MTTTRITKNIPVTRMDCPTCIPLLEREIKQLQGVIEVQGSYITKIVRVSYDPNQVQLEEIEATIERLGYRIAYKKYPSILSNLKRVLQRRKEKEITSLSDAQFADTITRISNPVAVLFSSSSCPTCQYFKRQLKEITANNQDIITIYEMDITRTKTWRQYDILSIPTVLIFRKGQVTERFEALPKVKEIIRAMSVPNR